MEKIFSPLTDLERIPKVKIEKNLSESRARLESDFKSIAKIISFYNPLEVLKRTCETSFESLKKIKGKERVAVALLESVLLQSVISSTFFDSNNISKNRDIKIKDINRLNSLTESVLRNLMKYLDFFSIFHVKENGLSIEEAETLRIKLFRSYIPQFETSERNKNLSLLFDAVCKENNSVISSEYYIEGDKLSASFQVLAEDALVKHSLLDIEIRTYQMQMEYELEQLKGKKEFSSWSEDRLKHYILKKNGWNVWLNKLSGMKDDFDLYRPDFKVNLPSKTLEKLSVEMGKLDMMSYFDKGYFISSVFPFLKLGTFYLSFVEEHLLSYSFRILEEGSPVRVLSHRTIQDAALGIFNATDVVDVYTFDGNKIDLAVLPSTTEFNAMENPGKIASVLNQRNEEKERKNMPGHILLIVDPDSFAPLKKKSDDIFTCSTVSLLKANSGKENRREFLREIFGELNLEDEEGSDLNPSEATIDEEYDEDHKKPEELLNDEIDLNEEDSYLDEYEYRESEEEEEMKLEERITTLENTVPDDIRKKDNEAFLKSIREKYEYVDKAVLSDDDFLDDSEDEFYKDEEEGTDDDDSEKGEDSSLLAQMEEEDEYLDEDDDQLDFLQLLDGVDLLEEVDEETTQDEESIMGEYESFIEREDDYPDEKISQDEIDEAINNLDDMNVENVVAGEDDMEIREEFISDEESIDLDDDEEFREEKTIVGDPTPARKEESSVSEEIVEEQIKQSRIENEAEALDRMILETKNRQEEQTLIEKENEKLIQESIIEDKIERLEEERELEKVELPDQIIEALSNNEEDEEPYQLIEEENEEFLNTLEDQMNASFRNLESLIPNFNKNNRTDFYEKDLERATEELNDELKNDPFFETIELDEEERKSEAGNAFMTLGEDAGTTEGKKKESQESLNWFEALMGSGVEPEIKDFHEAEREADEFIVNAVENLKEEKNTEKVSIDIHSEHNEGEFDATSEDIGSTLTEERSADSTYTDIQLDEEPGEITEEEERDPVTLEYDEEDEGKSYEEYVGEEKGLTEEEKKLSDEYEALTKERSYGERKGDFYTDPYGVERKREGGYRDIEIIAEQNDDIKDDENIVEEISSYFDEDSDSYISRIKQALESRGQNGAFLDFLGSAENDLLEYLESVFEKSWQSQQETHKDKIFTIFDYKITVLLAHNRIYDELRKAELLNNAGAVMYSKEEDDWNALILYIDEKGRVIEAIDERIDRDTFTSYDWKRVQNIGELLKERGKRG